MTIIEILVVLSALIVFWVFFGYAILLWVIGLFQKEKPQPGSENVPTVSIIVPTYNESAMIRKKIANLRELAYPKERMQVLFIDSASTDDTPGIVEREAPEFLCMREQERRGKAHAISTALPRTTGKIVMITDANAFMAPDVIQKLVRAFHDEQIGAATGAMRQIDGSNTAASKGGGLYWNMETFLRTREAQLHSVISMSGEISAFRRELFVTNENTVVSWYRPGGTDDFEMTLWVIRHHKRVAYVPDAAVWEYAPDNVRDLFRQKVRIIVQTMISVRRNVGMLFTSGAFGAFILPSRKILPLFAPWALLILFIGSLILTPLGGIWPVLAGLQSAFYLLALLGGTVIKRSALGRLAVFFVLLNVTVLFAWFDSFRGKDYTNWQPIRSSRRP